MSTQRMQPSARLTSVSQVSISAPETGFPSRLRTWPSTMKYSPAPSDAIVSPVLMCSASAVRNGPSTVGLGERHFEGIGQLPELYLLILLRPKLGHQLRLVFASRSMQLALGLGLFMVSTSALMPERSLVSSRTDRVQDMGTT